MEFEMKSHVYIKADDRNRIVRCEGEYTLPSDLSGWILIEEGTPCDRLNLAQSHYFPSGLYTMDGIPRYRWDGSAAVLRTEEELEADRTEEELEADRTAIHDPEHSTDLEARVAALEADAEQAALDRAALTLLLTGEETV